MFNFHADRQKKKRQTTSARGPRWSSTYYQQKPGELSISFYDYVKKLAQKMDENEMKWMARVSPTWVRRTSRFRILPYTALFSFYYHDRSLHSSLSLYLSFYLSLSLSSPSSTHKHKPASYTLRFWSISLYLYLYLIRFTLAGRV